MTKPEASDPESKPGKDSYSIGNVGKGATVAQGDGATVIHHHHYTPSESGDQNKSSQKGSYRYMVELIDKGTRIRVDARDPSGRTIQEPGGACAVAEKLPDLLALAEQIDQGDRDIRILNAFGESLFEALLPGDVMGNFRDLLARVMRETDSILRLELDLDEYAMPLIASLPWEFLRAPEREGRPGDNLATHRRVVLSRRRRLWHAAGMEINEPLRIQFIISEPTTMGPVKYADLIDGVTHLVDANPNQFAPLLSPLLNPSLTRIEEALEKDRPHIVHFIGHGQLNREGEKETAELALTSPTGRPKWISDADFAEVFQVQQPAIVVLQACEGGAVGRDGAFVGAASQIVQRNIPFVVGMQFPITNYAAVAFSEVFYQNIGQGKPVDVAVQLSRRSLGREFRNKRDFAAPVLFMRVEDGQLFS